ncbi:Kinesin light chain 3 [Hondaea fermentalgiana]|uniref:Kinesin light chain 3 n=1 Tax=Hondaea fermentalgiana TaxID=2315210 RepID=A0A2R5GBC2_9STRA|nr:Kinesin light chain 3 [Hondaea fermentalgiana]|eukprot:GBG25863.1 Kinesin light chain 3 [Hondaea fermentalgiana]
MDPTLVARRGVNLNYLVELFNTIDTNILCKNTELMTVRGHVVTDEGESLSPGMTLELVKRGTFLSMPKVRFPGSEKVFEIPRSKIEFKRRSHWTIKDVIEFAIKPSVAGRHTAIANVLDDRHVANQEFKCYYLSAPPHASLGKLVAALQAFFDGEDDDPTSVYFWFEPLNVDPFSLDEGNEEFMREYELSIVDRVGACSEHLVYVETWGFKDAHKPSNESFRHAKILWEIACARDEDLDTIVILPPEAKRDLLASFRSHGLTYFDDMMATISISSAWGLSYLADIFRESAEADASDSESEQDDAEADDEDIIARRAELTDRVVVKQLGIWFMHTFAHEVPRLAEKKDIQFRPTAKAINRIAVMHSRNEEWDEALKLFDFVIKFTRLGGGSHPLLAYSLNNKALILERKGDLASAVPLLREAIAILEATDGAESSCSKLVNNLITILEKLGDLEESESMLRRLVQLRTIAFGAGSVSVALALRHLGAVQTELGDIDAAKTSLLEALSILEKAREVDENDPELSLVIDDLATVYDIETNHTRDDGSGHHESVAATLFELAKVYKQQQQHEMQEEAARRGLELLTDVLGADHPETKKYERDLLE